MSRLVVVEYDLLKKERFPVLQITCDDANCVVVKRNFPKAVADPVLRLSGRRYEAVWGRCRNVPAKFSILTAISEIYTYMLLKRLITVW